ncbi:hypothetical protein DEF23_08050 [Marinitenerispora sediminis]|uniref:Uncharacterized protein n=1 Tax=Marinitenerispora sediminis TaxID=1931232 RepID=A0A368T1M4_9ACTN|nr:hypothetical protein DEF24_19840 [Marinitenerispora sediminis]RCV57095.1 hypothetical protein DEF28_02185 [Marinitenerispora sediminis]RCV58910.1 hypothetical protein DEF23_08050 [Marinitenerispora sediminis]
MARILAGFLVAVRQVDTSWSNLVWLLRCRAERAGLRARMVRPAGCSSWLSLRGWRWRRRVEGIPTPFWSAWFAAVC